MDNFPCGIAIVKAERHQDVTRFRIVSINRAARVFSNHLVIGKSFDERNPSPFDTSFVRLLIGSSQTHERRVAGRLNLYGSCLSLAARTIPLRDQCIGIAFEEASVVVPHQTSYAPQFPAKRSHAEVDSGYQILPTNQKHPHSQIPTSPPTAPSPVPGSPASPMYSTKGHDRESPVPHAHGRHSAFSPEPPTRMPRQLAPALMDIGMHYNFST